MINVDIRALIEKDGKEISRYALVSGVAKRALEISAQKEKFSVQDSKDSDSGNKKEESAPPKSVTLAVEELQRGAYEIIVPELNATDDSDDTGVEFVEPEIKIEF